MTEDQIKALVKAAGNVSLAVEVINGNMLAMGYTPKAGGASDRLNETLYLILEILKSQTETEMEKHEMASLLKYNLRTVVEDAFLKKTVKNT